MEKKKEDFGDIRNEEVRKKIWKELWDIEVKMKTHIRMKKLNGLTALPLILLSFLYTCYLSYYVPFFEFKKVKKIATIADIEALKPIAKFFKGILDEVPLDEPVLSIVGMVVVCLILPLIFGLIIKKVLGKKVKEKYEAEFTELPSNSIEQLRLITEKYDIKETSESKPQRGFVALHIISVLMYNVLMLIGRTFFALSDDNVGRPLILFIVYIVITVIHGKLLQMKGYYSVYDDYKIYDSVISTAKTTMKTDIKNKEKQEHDTALRDRVRSGFISLEAGEYEKAAEELGDIAEYYHKECKMEKYDKMEVIAGDIDDIELGLSIVKFKAVTAPDINDIAGIIGEIKKHTEYCEAYYKVHKLKKSKPVENDTVKRLSEEIREKYERRISDEIKADYEKGMQLFDVGEYIKSMAYLDAPSKMLYRDSLPAYALAKLLGENRTDDYYKIHSNLNFSEKCGIESKEIRQMVSSYKQKILDCWEEDDRNARLNSYRAQERIRRRMVCRYYNAGICNYQSNSAIIYKCNSEDCQAACSYYKQTEL